MLDAKRLRVLVELSRRGTLAAVAEALSYSPASVSQQLRVLEREVGIPLLTPAGRGVQLTPQAEVLVAHAIDILDLIEDAEITVARLVGAVVGTVRIAVLQSTMHSLLPGALTLLSQEAPGLRVEVSEFEPERGLDAVAAREVDLALAEQYPGNTRRPRLDLDHVLLASDPIYLARAADAPVHADARVNLWEARTAPWVLEPLGTASREWAEQTCRAAGFEPDVRFQTADLMAHLRLIRGGNAVGFLPALLFADGEPTVAVAPLPGGPLREVFTSARLSSAASPAVRAVRDALARSSAESLA